MSKPLRVLLVEDNADDADLVLRQLRRDGYQVASRRIETPEGMNACLDRQSWDVVLSDYVMPRFSAPDALRLLQGKEMDLPFIIVSGAVGEEMAAAAMKAGAHDYVRKDNLARLSAAIDRELREASDRQQRRRLEKQILEVSSTEQRRIGMDLHDTLGQDLTGIAFLVKLLAEKLSARQAPEAADAIAIGQRVNQAIGLTRSLARGLVPVDAGEEGLIRALHDLAGNVAATFGIDCRFNCPQPILLADSGMAMHLYQIAREAANNAITHGKAKHLDVTLTDSDGRITLIVRDDGSGLPAGDGCGTGGLSASVTGAGGAARQPGGAGSRGNGIGLHVMNHRARMIGGVLSVQATAEGGTAVTCTVRRAGNQ